MPQMADGAEVVAAVTAPDVTLGGLVPNMKGLEAGLEAGLTYFGVLTAASEEFCQRNLNATVDESMHRVRNILFEAPGEVRFRGYISTATHCPFEGEQDPDWVAHLAETLIEWGVEDVYLGETIGKATPYHVERLLGEVLDRVPVERVGVHFHDTYGQAVANTVSALDHGIDKMDSSAGGLGGCPYAPGAMGNVATEDLIWLLDGMGIEHGLAVSSWPGGEGVLRHPRSRLSEPRRRACSQPPAAVGSEPPTEGPRELDDGSDPERPSHRPDRRTSRHRPDTAGAPSAGPSCAVEWSRPRGPAGKAESLASAALQDHDPDILTRDNPLAFVDAADGEDPRPPVRL